MRGEMLRYVFFVGFLGVENGQIGREMLMV